MKTILITGANRGIGLELARQYAEEGWRVLACSRRPEEARDLTALGSAFPQTVALRRLEVTKDSDIAALSQELKEEKIDILFNNAGVFGPQKQGLGPIDAEEWLQTFRVNVVAPYKVTLGFLEQVGRSEGRTVAIMGSLMGSLSDNRSGGYYPYRSSKAAVAQVVRSLAADLRSRGIAAVVLHPGWVQTDMGGPGATLTPRESVAEIRKVLASVDLEKSGRFYNYDGRELPW